MTNHDTVSDYVCDFLIDAICDHCNFPESSRGREDKYNICENCPQWIEIRELQQKLDPLFSDVESVRDSVENYDSEQDARDYEFELADQMIDAGCEVEYGIQAYYR